LSAYNAIGVLYAQDEEHLKALPYFCQAAQINPQFGRVGENFDRALFILQTQKEENPKTLYENMISGESFQKAAAERIRYTDRECSEEGCAFFFASRFEPGEVVLPILIQGITATSRMVSINDSSFNPQTGGIKIDSDARHTNATITFIFPTCEGIYYEATAQPQ